MNWGDALLPSCRVSLSTILPMLYQSAALKRCAISQLEREQACSRGYYLFQSLIL